MKKIFSVLINIYKKYGNLFQGKGFHAFILFYKHQREWGAATALMYVIKEFGHIHVIKDKNKARAIGKLLGRVRIVFERKDSLFVYPVDECVALKLRGKILGNCCVNYRKIVDSSLEDLKMDGDDGYCAAVNSLIDSVSFFINRIIEAVGREKLQNGNSIIKNLESIGNEPASTLEDALQRILLINAIQWQTGHILVGLGRLDWFLDRFKDDGRSDDDLRAVLKDFLKKLHCYYCLKSNALMGDTGQIIILGGNTPEGGYFYNRFTVLIMEAIKELELPDPKVLVRISAWMPDIVWKKTVELMKSGGGSPLISNDDVVIPAMLEFGYPKEAAFEYTTSACWEPMPGEGCEQNNIVSINLLEPFGYISDRLEEEVPSTFDDFLKLYYAGLKQHVDSVLKYIDGIDWEEDPVISIFNKSSRQKHLDVAFGGAETNNYGLLTVAMGNAVDSLMNIKKLVYEDKVMTLKDLDRIRRKDFKENEEIRELLARMPKIYGMDDEDTISFVNGITGKLHEMVSGYRNKFGGKVKIGLSSPHYIMNSTGFPASFDGRRQGDPFAVHISNDGADHLGLMNFASHLCYNNGRFNGNVVDMVVSPAMINDRVQKEKFTASLLRGFRQGMFQLQINCISAEQLRRARENPKDFPDLIVRVWGFNTYFVQLPAEYQDYLIKRAEQYERAT